MEEAVPSLPDAIEGNVEEEIEEEEAEEQEDVVSHSLHKGYYR